SIPAPGTHSTATSIPRTTTPTLRGWRTSAPCSCSPWHWAEHGPPPRHAAGPLRTAPAARRRHPPAGRARVVRAAADGRRQLSVAGAGAAGARGARTGGPRGRAAAPAHGRDRPRLAPAARRVPPVQAQRRRARQPGAAVARARDRALRGRSGLAGAGVGPGGGAAVFAGSAGGAGAGAARRTQVRGSVTPRWPWYLPPRSLYEVSQTSSGAAWKNSICATPSLAGMRAGSAV